MGVATLSLVLADGVACVEGTQTLTVCAFTTDAAITGAFVGGTMGAIAAEKVTKPKIIISEHRGGYN